MTLFHPYEFHKKSYVTHLSSEVTVCCVSLVAVVSWEKVVSGLGDTIDIVDTLLFPKDILFKDKKSIEI